MSEQINDNGTTTTLNPVVAANPQTRTDWIAVHKRYKAVLPEYTDYGINDGQHHDYVRPNTGWKIHLNVAPEHVREVSQFLKGSGFMHKYISDADIEQGKIFTVYFGSKTLAERNIIVVCNGVGHLLEEPRAQGELQVAPRIVARFDINDELFMRHGYADGLPLLKHL